MTAPIRHPDAGGTPPHYSHAGYGLACSAAAPGCRMGVAMRQVLVMLVLTSSAAGGFAAEPEAHVFKADGKSLPYRLLKSADTEAGKKYPLM